MLYHGSNYLIEDELEPRYDSYDEGYARIYANTRDKYERCRQDDLY